MLGQCCHPWKQCRNNVATLYSAKNRLCESSHETSPLKLARIIGRSPPGRPWVQKQRAVYKSGTGTRGRGHWDACVGTWDLGTRGEGRGDIWYETRDVWDAGTYGTRGRVGRGRGDVKCRGRAR